MSARTEKVANLIRELAATWIERESNKDALITITRADISPDLKNATVYMTVMPTSKERGALGFAKRKRGELRTYLKKKMSIKNIPFVDIEIDQGEKHRQKIDRLLNEN